MIDRVKTFFLGLFATAGVFILFEELIATIPKWIRTLSGARLDMDVISVWVKGVIPFFILLWLSSRFFFSRYDPDEHRVTAMALITGFSFSVLFMLFYFHLNVLMVLIYILLVGLFQYVMLKEEGAFHWILGLIAIWPMIILMLSSMYIGRLAEPLFIRWFMIGVFSVVFSLAVFLRGKSEWIGIPLIVLLFWLCAMLLSHRPLVIYLVWGEESDRSWTYLLLPRVGIYSALIFGSILPGYLLLGLEKLMGKKREVLL